MRRGALRASQGTVGRGVVPLPRLPARIGRAGDGVRERRRRRFSFTSGESEVRTFKSSSFGHRLFCGACGTPIAMQVDHQPETIDFSVATLDEPDAVPPGFHIFYDSRVAWFKTTDDLPRHERFRPNTRGLTGTEPPV